MMTNGKKLAMKVCAYCSVAVIVYCAVNGLLVKEIAPNVRSGVVMRSSLPHIALTTLGGHASVGLGSISVVTWNVWFGEFTMEKRYDEILSICKSLSADVICFQEVTTAFVGKIREHSLADHYDISDYYLDGSTLGSYGVLTMSRRELNANFQWHDLPTEMDRKLLTATFNTPAGPLVVGNIHLESLNTASTRAAQLQQSNDILNHTPNALLCGDFNFDSEKNFRPGSSLENDVLSRLLPTYEDAWLELHTLSTGKTYDTEMNHMLLKKNERMRYDRIMVRKDNNQHPHLVLKNITLLGTAPLGYNLPISSKRNKLRLESTPAGMEREDTRPVFPSDHFGLHAELVFVS